MIWLYRLIFWPIFILLMPGYLIKLWRRGGRWHIAERFGFVHPPQKKSGVKRIWVHAVSVGELNGVKPFLLKLKERPDVEVVLSVTTTTARKIAEDKMKELYSYIFTFPIDIFSGRTLRRLKADKLVLMEGELWPETLTQAPKYGTKVYLINGRMSDRSFRRMMLGRGVVKYFLKKVERILTATKQDTERYLALGANPKIVSQTGSLKFDAVQSKPIDAAKRAELLKSLGFGESDTIIIGSSTWEGEEAALVDAYFKLQEDFRGLKLLLVPRHAERRNEIEALLIRQGLNYHRRTSNLPIEHPDIVLADTTGELSCLVQISHVVFVGKSLNPRGEGQTPIEAAAAGKPVIMGYGMSNFRLIAQDLADEGGGKFVGGPQELKEFLRIVLNNPAQREEMGKKARAWFDENRGATAKTSERLGL